MATKEDLIVKLYEGTCSPKELEALLDLMLQDEEGKDREEIMTKLWEEFNSYPELKEPMAARMRKEMFERVAGKESIERRNTPSNNQVAKKNFKRKRIAYVSAAASILILLGALSWVWFGTTQMMIVETEFAEQKTVELPDLSVVILNANSSLRFNKKWDATQTRQVWLEGEAYFEVKKNKKTGQKFQVITKDLTINVLGTVFNVNTREVSTKVFLEEGKISLKLEDQSTPILMKPGELLSYSKTSGKHLTKPSSKINPVSWKDGLELMDNALLTEIIQKIQELYGIKIEVENRAYLNRRYTIGLLVDNPEMAYEAMTAWGLKIEKVEKTWIIK